MGSFHCVSSDCAQIRYQPYRKTGAIRYRYEGENWKTVEGSSYELQQFSSCATHHRINAKMNTVYKQSNGTLYPIGERYAQIYYFETGLLDRYELRFGYFQAPKGTGALQVRFFSDIYPEGSRWISLFQQAGDYWLPEEFAQGNYTFTLRPHQYSTVDACNICKLIIKKEDSVVFSRSSLQCPEVEQEVDGHKLSDRTEVIKVKKSAYLQQVEVTNQGIETYGSDGSLFDTYPLPEECLNIYKTFVDVSSTSNNSDLAAETSSSYEFVAQICSRPGCPPPEYEVICNCSQECPSGTCAVFCGNHVCCHDPSTGTAIEQIPIDEYVRGN